MAMKLPVVASALMIKRSSKRYLMNCILMNLRQSGNLVFFSMLSLLVPRLMGVCIWSPRLDAVGNSVRGVEMANRLTQIYRLHLYDGVAARSERIDLRTLQIDQSQSVGRLGAGFSRPVTSCRNDHADAKSDVSASSAPSGVEAHTSIVPRSADGRHRNVGTSEKTIGRF